MRHLHINFLLEIIKYAIGILMYIIAVHKSQ